MNYWINDPLTQHVNHSYDYIETKIALHHNFK